MSLFLATLAIFALVILIMAIGVLMGRREIEGSCGGPHGCDFCLFKHSARCSRSASCENPPTQLSTGTPPPPPTE